MNWKFVVMYLAFLAYLILRHGGCGAVHWDGGAEHCDDACKVLAELGCDGADGSPGDDETFGTADDVPCASVCRETMGMGVDMHPACVAASESCEAVEACFN
jgi:hypothetical protein